MGIVDSGGGAAGRHPSVEYDENGRPYYDSSAEPEATGRKFEQSMNIAPNFSGGHCDLPMEFEVEGSGEDLLTASSREND